MRNAFSYLFILPLLISCSDNDDIDALNIGDRFTHDIPDCDNSENAEVNCTEFLEIYANNEASLLYGGGDISQRFNYRIDGNTLYLEKEPTSSFALPFHFKILQDKNLERSDNGDIWIKGD